MSSVIKCPICGKPVEVDEPNRPATFPFCSDRCKLVDLGRWLSGKYQIPVSGPSEEDQIDLSNDPIK